MDLLGDQYLVLGQAQSVELNNRPMRVIDPSLEKVAVQQAHVRVYSQALLSHADIGFVD